MPIQQMLTDFKTPIIQLLLVVLASGLMLGAAFFYAQEVDRKKAETLQQQLQINSDIDRLIEDDEIIYSMSADFVQLTSKGFYAQEDRLAWSEILKQLSEQLKLPNFQYSISPQKNISNIGSGFQADLGLSESLMEIEADLLHEGDFLSITEQLSVFAPALFNVRGCFLKKEKFIALTHIKRNIALKCTLAWYTVKPLIVNEEG